MDFQSLVDRHIDTRAIAVVEDGVPVREVTRLDLVEVLMSYPGIYTTRERKCPDGTACLDKRPTVERCEKDHVWLNGVQWVDERPLMGGEDYRTPPNSL